MCKLFVLDNLCTIKKSWGLTDIKSNHKFMDSLIDVFINLLSYVSMYEIKTGLPTVRPVSYLDIAMNIDSCWIVEKEFIV